MQPSEPISSLTLSEKDIQQLLAQTQTLVRLIEPLMLLLSSASGQTSGAGQRLEELIQQLTWVVAGLQQTMEMQEKVFGPSGTLIGLEQRLSGVEAQMRRQTEVSTRILAGLTQMTAWMSGSA
ncbi:hypothetical protein ACEN2J_19545 [Pseudorhodobacter sp. W20_MBD10_FR17]|uniref:hypothetical protein n=1 Tax=Pseudorhodobacter sp. W20_MBD10_FR17 TaxID=3240266 RepID=UPI003F9588FA